MSGGTGDGWKKWAPRLVVESIVVVISILLALVVNEWRAEAELTERRDRAMEAIPPCARTAGCDPSTW